MNRVLKPCKFEYKNYSERDFFECALYSAVI